MIHDALVATLLVVGGLFILVAALGVARMPDLVTRMHAATKAGTLGVGCILAAVALRFSELGVSTRVALVILFVFLTAPLAAHMIARAASTVGLELWSGTILNELPPRREKPDEGAD